MFFMLPLFGQTVNGDIQETTLTALTAISPWLWYFYLAAVSAMAVIGILTLALQNSSHSFWSNQKRRISLSGNLIAAFLFILSRQPYAAALTLTFLIIKVLIHAKKP